MIRKSLLASAVLLLAAGCSDGGTPARVATAVSVTPGSLQLDAVGATRMVRAVVNDQDGKPMTGAAVTWASSAGSVTVASAGGDSAIVTGAGNGSATITATAGGASGTATVQVAQVATSIAAAGGDAQTGAVATALPNQLQVVVRDRLNAPVPGITISFTVQGGGTVTAPSAVTGANGVAS
ncbi:Ig-like domain-containing protein, partial [Longimicrobium sp.]|uniref:Ig-like domain-containing protein n=1 Tax=Longimicrobium sp. TaxID=2029185 RepID=UPI002E35B671